MNRIVTGLLVCVALIILLGTACAGSGGNGRQIAITQTDDGCMPLAVQAVSGEKLSFKVQNQGKRDHEFAGINGAKVPAVEAPAGRTRSIDYTAPKRAGTQQIKCNIPNGSLNGSRTILSVTAGK